MRTLLLNKKNLFSLVMACILFAWVSYLVANLVHASSRKLAGASAAQRELFRKFSGVEAALRRHADSGNVDMNQLDQSMSGLAEKSKEINSITQGKMPCSPQEISSFSAPARWATFLSAATCLPA